jgi:hypothetical protein
METVEGDPGVGPMLPPTPQHPRQTPKPSRPCRRPLPRSAFFTHFPVEYAVG